jgi:predicted HicB family RNase H-like nuclease
MMNLMKINGFSAVINYDPEIEMFRGEFVDLNGSADFYAKDIENLKKEGTISLKVFLDACKRRDIEPKKKFAGEFNISVPSDLHADIASAANAEGKSLNQWIIATLAHAVHMRNNKQGHYQFLK